MDARKSEQATTCHECRMEPQGDGVTVKPFRPGYLEDLDREFERHDRIRRMNRHEFRRRFCRVFTRAGVDVSYGR